MAASVAPSFTKDECELWQRNKNRNPRTNRPISNEGKIYAKLAIDCRDHMANRKSPPHRPSDKFTKEECAQWKHDKSRNPRTKRPISKDAKGGVYHKLAVQCNTNSQGTTGFTDVALNTATQEAYDKYCRCLMKVRPTLKGKPYEKGVYGICNKSVLQSRNMKSKPKYCIYDFNEFDVSQLIAYADELEGRKKWGWRLSAKARAGDKKLLVKELQSITQRMENTYAELKKK